MSPLLVAHGALFLAMAALAVLTVLAVSALIARRWKP